MRTRISFRTVLAALAVAIVAFSGMGLQPGAGDGSVAFVANANKAYAASVKRIKASGWYRTDYIPGKTKLSGSTLRFPYGATKQKSWNMNGSYASSAKEINGKVSFKLPKKLTAYTYTYKYDMAHDKDCSRLSNKRILTRKGLIKAAKKQHSKYYDAILMLKVKGGKVTKAVIVPEAAAIMYD